MRRIDYMQEGESFKNMTAGHFMQQGVYYYSFTSRGDSLASAMTLGGFGSLPIVDEEKKLIGIVSEFDLLAAMKDKKELEEIVAGEIMTKKPISVSEETCAEGLIELLQRERLVRVPVVDQAEKLVGIVSRRDILKGYLKSKETRPPWWF